MYDENIFSFESKQRVLKRNKTVNYNAVGLNSRDLNQNTRIELQDILKRPLPVHSNSNRVNSLDKARFVQRIESLGSSVDLYAAESPSIVKLEAYEEKLRQEKQFIEEVCHQNIPETPIDNAEDSFDCAPFYKLYDYESKFETDDYAGVTAAMLDDETNGIQRVFPRELEFQELKELVGKFENVLHYLFGLDPSGFFELKQERHLFYSIPHLKYTMPTTYNNKKYRQHKFSSDIYFEDDSVSWISQEDDMTESLSQMSEAPSV